MANHLNEYEVKTTDWRATLRQNQFRTRVVVFIFMLIYTGVGLLIDTAMGLHTYPYATAGEIFQALITLQIFPIATLIMLIVALVSLWITYSFYDKLMLLGTEYHEITPDSARSPEETRLYNVVEEMKVAAGLAYMPKVFIIEADYMNAFASGYSEKSAMVAITRGLMQKLTRDELQAVMAHEISHIRHMDIKLTLTASLLANLPVMVIDMVFYSIIYGGNQRSERRDRGGNIIIVVVVLLRYLLPVINILLLLYLSRTRELMADAGCVELTRTNTPLASALIKINDDHQQNRDEYNQAYQQTPHENVRREAYIFDPVQAGIESAHSISDLFSTHPSLATRLAALGIRRHE